MTDDLMTPIRKFAQTRIVIKRGLQATGVAAMLLSGTVLGGYAWLCSDAGREWARHAVASVVSDETMQLHIGDIPRLSWRGIVVRDVALSERDDVLLHVDRVKIDINPKVLIWKRFEILLVDVGKITFNRLPTAQEKPKKVEPYTAFSIPDLRIEKLDIGLAFAENPEALYTLKGQIKLHPASLVNSVIDLDLVDPDENKLVEARLLKQKNEPLLYARILDEKGLFLRRIGGMENAGKLDITLHGNAKDMATWQGNLIADIEDIILADVNVSIVDMQKKPVVTLNGAVTPLIIDNQSVRVKAVASLESVEAEINADQWVIDETMIVRNVALNIAMNPVRKFRVQQGYAWELDAAMDDVLDADNHTLSPYTQKIILKGKGIIGNTSAMVESATLGNELWQAQGKGNFDLVRQRWTGEVRAELRESSVVDLLGAVPFLSSNMTWDAQSGLLMHDGVIDANKIKGSFHGNLDAQQHIALRMNAKTDGFAPYFTGPVTLGASVQGDVSNPDIIANILGRDVTLDDGTVIPEIAINAEGNTANNILQVKAQLPDGEYTVKTSLAIMDNAYELKPLDVHMPMGHITGCVRATQNETWNIQADLDGTAEGQSVSLKSAVTVDTRADDLKLVIETLQAKWKELSLRLKQPVTLQQQENKWQWTSAQLDMGGGTLALNGFYDPADMNVDMRLTHIPLAGLGLPVASGFADGSVTLKGAVEKPVLDADIALSRLVLDEMAGRDNPVSLSGRIKARAADEVLSGTASLAGSGGMKLDADASVPLRLVPFELKDNAPLTGKANGAIDLAALGALLGLDGHDLGGRATLRVALAGTVKKPDVNGTVTLSGASYDNVIWGTALRHIDARISMSSDRLVLDHFSARDKRSGTMTGKGNVHLAPLNNPAIDAAFSTRHMRLMNSTGLTATASSDVLVKGRLRDLVMSGDVEIHSAEVYVNDIVGTGDPYRDYTVIEKNTGAGQRASYVVTRAEPEYPVAMRMRINAANGIFVRGPGLESEWSASLVVLGTTDVPRLGGSLSVLRGSYQFVDLLVRLDPKSKVSFAGDASNPSLDMSGVIPGKTLNATLSVTGTAQKPVVELGSDQGLPSDEVLARVIFGRSASSLSPAQAVQVARVLARLTGGGGGGFDPVGIMRKALGVDTLGVSMGDESGAGPTVSAGKYISDDIYVSVEQGTTPGSSTVKSEIGLTDNIQLESSVSNSSESKVGVQWKWDY